VLQLKGSLIFQPWKESVLSESYPKIVNHFPGNLPGEFIPDADPYCENQIKYCQNPYSCLTFTYISNRRDQNMKVIQPVESNIG